MGISVKNMPIWKVGRKGTEQTGLRNVRLKEVMTTLIRALQQRERGIYVPTVAMGNQGHPRSWGDGAGWVNHLAQNNGLILLVASEWGVKYMYSALRNAARALGLAVKDDKLDLWSTYRGRPSRSAATFSFRQPTWFLGSPLTRTAQRSAEPGRRSMSEIWVQQAESCVVCPQPQSPSLDPRHNGLGAAADPPCRLIATIDDERHQVATEQVDRQSHEARRGVEGHRVQIGHHASLPRPGAAAVGGRGWTTCRSPSPAMTPM